jgi:hypothetical protein
MIESERLTLSEYVGSDNSGVITEWMKRIDPEARGVIDQRLLEHAYARATDLAYESKFVPLRELHSIPFRAGTRRYMILGTFMSIREFVMLMGFDEPRGTRPSSAVKQEARRRLQDLQEHPRHHRGYRFN